MDLPTDEECEVIRAHARELREELVQRSAGVRPGDDDVRFPVLMTMLNWLVVEVLGWVDYNAEGGAELPREERRRRVAAAIDMLARGTMQSIFDTDGSGFLFDEDKRESLN
jgi:hypothetical protein